MIPLSIHAEHFGPYKTLDWSPPDGLTAVLGVNNHGDGVDSNGAGKSKLLETIPIALFGPPLAWSEYLSLSADPDESCKVELEFEHRGERYRVRRIFSAKGRGKTSLDFEQSLFHAEDDGPNTSAHAVLGWEPLTLETQAETQKALELLLGMSETTFAHSAYAAQGARHFADPELPPRERKQILADALGLGVWDQLLELVRMDVRGIEGEAALLEARMGDWTADLGREAELKAERDALGDATVGADHLLAEAEALKEQTRAKYDAANASRAAGEGLATRLAAAQGALERIEGQRLAGAAASEEADRLTVTLAAAKELAGTTLTLGEQIAVLEQSEAKARERSALLTRSAEHANRDQTLALQEETYRKRALQIAADVKTMKSAETAECDRCGQPIADAALDRTVAGMLADAANLVEQADGFREERERQSDRGRSLKEEADAIVLPDAAELATLGNLRTRLAAASQAALDHAAGSERLRGLQETVAAVRTQEFRTAWDEAEQARDEAKAAIETAEAPTQEQVDELVRIDGDADLRLRTARTASEQAKIALARSEERLETLASLRLRHGEAHAERERLSVRLDVLKALERSYGRDGIPALILESTAIPQIESEAARILGALGTPFRVELRTQRETKGGSLRDTLDVVVHEPNGARDYRTYSGGERARLSVALRLAIARLLAHRRGAEVGVLILDELEALDVAGQQALVGLLRGLQSEFPKIIVVSHDPLVADSFDQSVVVVKDDGGSRLGAAA